jgi:hypothetical protein
MLTRRVNRAGFALLLLAAVWFFGSTRTEAAEDAKDTKLTKLLKERLAILKEIAAETEKAFKSGAMQAERLIEANEAVLKAELDLCKSDKERIAVLEKLVTTAKQREEQFERLVKLAAIPNSALLKSKVSRLEAEIALERAKQEKK